MNGAGSGGESIGERERLVRRQIKEIIVSELHLRNRTAESIADDVRLFGPEGLGLDSLDALQLAVAIEERFAVRLPEGKEAAEVYASVESLGRYVLDHAPSSSDQAPTGGL